MGRWRLGLVVVALAGMVAAPALVRAEPAVEEALLPAWRALLALRAGDGTPLGPAYVAILEDTGVRLAVADLPPGVYGRHRPGQHAVLVNAAIVGEDPRAVAAVLAHELTHVIQADRGLVGQADCVRREVDAFLTQTYVWGRFLDGAELPGGTALERHLGDVLAVAEDTGEAGLEAFVLSAPRYREQCRLVGE